MTTLATAAAETQHPGARRIIVMIGAPGAGKGTQAERLASELGLPHISTGQLFREAVQGADALGARVKEHLGSGGLVPDDITVAVVEGRLGRNDAAGGAILDGFPRTVAQAVALDEMLARSGSAVTAAIYVEVAPELLKERLTGRRICTHDHGHVYHVLTRRPAREGICDLDGAELYQREDDSPRTAQRRLDSQLPPMYEVIDHYADQGVLYSVRGDRPADEVGDELVRILTIERASE